MGGVIRDDEISHFRPEFLCFLQREMMFSVSAAKPIATARRPALGMITSEECLDSLLRLSDGFFRRF